MDENLLNQHFLFRIFTLIGVSHALFLIIFILNASGKKDISQKIFIGILIALSFRMTKWVAYFFDTSQLFIVYNFFCYGLQAIIGSLVLLYLKSYKKELQILSVQNIILLLPLPVLVVLGGFFTKTMWNAYISYVIGVITIYWLLTLIWSVMECKRLLIHDTQDKNDSIWLKYFVGINVVFALAFAMYFFLFNEYENIFSFIFLSGTILMSYLFFNLQLNKKIEKSKVKNDTEYNESLISEINKIIENKVFLDSEMSMPKMAEMLGVSSHTLSNNINNYYQKNFSDFINTYRLAHAAELLVSPAYVNIKIAVIAYDSGFNSLSSFNNLFKNKYGFTPSEFRKAKKNSKI